jgi:hypothetical protein
MDMWQIEVIQPKAYLHLCKKEIRLIIPSVAKVWSDMSIPHMPPWDAA